MNFFLIALISFLLCFVYISLARRRSWLDYPNRRSSHRLPVPTGGGIAIFISFSLAIKFLPGSLELNFSTVLLALSTLLLALVGFLDDIYCLGIASRGCIYLTISAIAVFTIFFENNYLSATYLEIIFASLGLFLFLNLYNFMDGIDGLLSVHTVISTLLAIFLFSIQAKPTNLILLCSILCAVHIGFLSWNWSPASLFMGDAGSIPTGFLLGIIAFESVIEGTVSIAAWLIIFSPFLADSLSTLLVRALRLKNIFKPHSSHIYQKLARKWNSHHRVVFAMIVFQCFWCAPLVYCVVIFPEQENKLVMLAYLPLALGLVNTRNLA